MSWNHRVLAYKQPNGEVYLKIHEVYYDEDNVPNAYSSNPISLQSETLQGINWTLNKMKECLKKPVLWEGDKFPQECKITYECDYCRNEFTSMKPHNCIKGFRKTGLCWTTLGR